MRVLIVDDEEHVREGIELAINQEAFGVTKRLHAESGEEALRLIAEYAPNIVFLDMSMPGMHGMQLLEEIHKHYPNIQIIVVSGYNDFGYARATIKAGGVDYILKPFKKKDLQQAMAQAVAACRQREQSLRLERDVGFLNQQADLQAIEQQLNQYLRGDTAYAAKLADYLQKIKLAPQSLRATLIAMRNSIFLIERSYHGNAELFIYSIRNIADEILASYGPHLLCRIDEFNWLLLTAESESNVANKLQFFIDKLQVGWRDTIKLESLSGTSEAATDLEHLPQQLASARLVLLDSPITENSTSLSTAEKLPQLSDQEMLLEIAVAEGNKAYAAEIIHEYAEQLRASGILRYKDLQRITREANAMLERVSRSVQQNMTDFPIAPVSLAISYIDEWETQAKLAWWKLIEEAGGEAIGRRGIEAIHTYIQQHFHERIMLSDLAEQFHFNSQYIARKFKETYNTTIVTYQTELRMEKAASLLANTDLSIIKIAEIVGYTDENYFSKVFRKHTGIPPLKYRKRARGQ